MGLFGKSKEEKERDELKSQVDKLMQSYDDEEIDGATYIEKMMDLTTSHKKIKSEKSPVVLIETEKN